MQDLSHIPTEIIFKRYYQNKKDCIAQIDMFLSKIKANNLPTEHNISTKIIYPDGCAEELRIVYTVDCNDNKIIYTAAESVEPLEGYNILRGNTSVLDNLIFAKKILMGKEEFRTKQNR